MKAFTRGMRPFFERNALFLPLIERLVMSFSDWNRDTSVGGFRNTITTGTSPLRSRTSLRTRSFSARFANVIRAYSCVVTFCDCTFASSASSASFMNRSYSCTAHQ